MTIDKSRDENKKGTLPAFAPVPRQRNRHDGWTAERQRGFIAALADTGSVRAAAHAVNMTPETAYQLRRHPKAQGFRKAWEAALKCGVQRLEDIAMERALCGVEVPVYSYGKLIGTRCIYNDSLLMFLLRNRARKRFVADFAQRHDAVTRRQLDRLKQQWRAEWDAEQEAGSQGVLDSIDQWIDDMRERSRAGMSDEERRLEAELAAARERRTALPWYGPGGDDADDADDDAGEPDDIDRT